MKLRAGACVLLLSFVAPAVITEAGLPSAPLAEPRSFAQADPVTEVARQRYQDGVKAFDAGRYEDARAAFLQVYSLKRHPAVLLNLGQSELRSLHHEDAGNHFQQFLREHKDITPDQKAAAEKGIDDAKKRAGIVIVIVDANGADVSINGTSFGKSPLPDPVFVKPGKHTVFVSYGGKSATTQVDAKPGAVAAANLTLGTTGAGLPVAPVPAPGPSPSPAAPSPAQPGPAAPPSSPGYQPGGPASITTSGMGTMEPDQASSGREPLLDWYTRKPIAWVGTGVAGLGLVGLVLFSALSADSSGSVDDITATINEYAAANPDTTQGRTDGYCGPRDDPGHELPDYKKACGKLRDKLDAYDTEVALAVTGGVLLGVGVIGTVTYAMLDWYPKKNRSAQGPKVTALAPMVGHGQAGLGIAGTF